MLKKDKEVIKRWKENFEELLNEEFLREKIEWSLGMVDLIRKKKSWSVVRKMENKKVVGLDGVSVEVWKVLESLGIRRLTKNFNKVLVEA